MPSVTVLMSAYNAQDCIRNSVESVLKQTFKDFEFVIVNDGSTDNTQTILEEYAARDTRIKLIHQNNTGLTKALNNGLKSAAGKYIARLDADDLAMPQRLEKQFKLMEKSPEIVLCGSNCENIFPDGSKTEWRTHEEDALQHIVFRQTPFAHSTIMMKKEICDELGGYDESYKTAQDMELWIRFAKKGRIAMLSEVLVKRSISENMISKKRRWQQFKDASRARWIHNDTLFKKLCAQYTGFRMMIIESLPHRLITLLKASSTK